MPNERRIQMNKHMTVAEVKRKYPDVSKATLETLATKAYPAIIRKGATQFVSYIPDFDIGTQGKTIAEAIEMSRDAIAMVCKCYIEEGRSLPTPSDYFEVKCRPNEIKTLIDVNFKEEGAHCV